MIRKQYALISGAILLMSINLAFAGDAFEPFFELLIMGGISALDADDTDLVITPSETDTLTQTNGGDWNSWTGQVGISYVYPLTDTLKTGDVQWFPSINPQLNLYYLQGNNIEGDVNQYQSADFNLLDYNMDYHSTRLMFDLGLSVASINWFTIYALGGVGVAWNEIDLSATPNALGLECGVVGYDLNSENSTSFTYEIGAGISLAVMDNLALSLEYLYTGFSDVKLGDDANLNINGQSLLLGLRFAL